MLIAPPLPVDVAEGALAEELVETGRRQRREMDVGELGKREHVDERPSGMVWGGN
jgi:hypothetical protein